MPRPGSLTSRGAGLPLPAVFAAVSLVVLAAMAVVVVLMVEWTVQGSAAPSLLGADPGSGTDNPGSPTRNAAIVAGTSAFGVWLLLVVGLVQITRRVRRQVEQSAELALHDSLTGLPNRRMLNDRLERAAALSARSGARVALLVVNVDRFKEINDTLGHDRGDDLLREVARRLIGAVREMDTVARLGADEFGVLLPAVGRIEDAERFARRLQAVFDAPFEIGGLSLHVDASTGLVVYPDLVEDVSIALQRADVAMHVAKSAHLGLMTYSESIDPPDGEGQDPSQLMLLGDLHNALDDPDQLDVWFQPKVSLRTGEVVGLEALLRWHHPVRGLVGPAEFIPLAERTGLIHPLTRNVLESVVRRIADWDQQGREIPVAVNLSARNLSESGLAAFIGDLLDRHGVHPVLLELEVTESAMVEDPVRAKQVLDELGALGVQISLDDFGSGYTSMAQLERIPLRSLKIDRELVWRILTDPAGSVMVKAIIDLAHEFNLVAVAEGVEQPEMLAELRRLGCDVAQGYHWSAPVPAAQVHEVIDRIHAARTTEAAGR